MFQALQKSAIMTVIIEIIIAGGQNDNIWSTQGSYGGDGWRALCIYARPRWCKHNCINDCFLSPTGNCTDQSLSKTVDNRPLKGISFELLFI